MQDTILRLCASTALVGVLALPATAQQIINLEEITFSANLTPTEIARSGSSVTVITRETLEQAGSTQLVDLLARTPGVSLTRNGGPGSNASLRIRGAGDQFVSVLIDGIRVGDPTELRGSYELGHTNLHDIGRVEILRGSQSAIYGGNAIAGVISISTLGAHQDGFSQSVAVEAGSYRTFLGRYSLGFRDDRFEAALNLSRVQTAGFSAYEGPIGSPRNPPDAFRSNRLSLSARYQLAELLAIGFSGFAQDSYSEYDFPTADADESWKRREAGLRGFVEFEIGEAQNEIALSRYELKRNRFSSDVQQGWFNGNRTELIYQGNLALAGGFDLGWGADWTREEGEFDASFAGKEKVDTKGIYGQLQWQVTEALDISASARVDRHSSFGSQLSTRLAAVWAVNDNIRLRGAIGSGFAAPSIPQRFGADYSGPRFVFIVGPNADLKPETSRSAEIGADFSLGAGAEISTTLFQLTTDNLIEFCALDPDAFGGPCLQAGPAGFSHQYQNLTGKTKRRGFEFAAAIPVTDDHQFDAAYTYVDARDPSGARLARIPRHDLNLGLRSDWSDRVSSTISLQHIGGRTGGMPSYSVVNAGVRYRVNDTADLTLRIENLFDKQYQQVSGYGTSDRAFYLGVASRF